MSIKSLVSVSLGVAFIAIGAPQAQAALITYTNAATFNLAAPGLPTETFEAVNPGAGLGVPVDAPQSNATNPGFLPGVTYDVANKSGPGMGGLALLGPGFGGIATTTLIENFFGDTLKLKFGPGVTAAGFDALSLQIVSNLNVSIFGAGGLLGTAVIPGASTSETDFFGVTSSTLITEIDLATTSLILSSTGIDNLEFGNASIAVPEPSSAILLVAALCGLLGLTRLRVSKP